MKPDGRINRVVKYHKRKIISFIKKNKNKKDLKKVTIEKFKISPPYYYKLHKIAIIDIKPLVKRISFTVGLHQDIARDFRKEVKRDGQKINGALTNFLYKRLGIKNNLELQNILGEDFKKNNVKIRTVDKRGIIITLSLDDKKDKKRKKKGYLTITRPVLISPKISLRPFSSRETRK